MDSGPTLRLEFSGRHEPHILRIFAQNKPAHVLLDGGKLTEGAAWRYDSTQHRLIIKTRDYDRGSYEIITQPEGLPSR